MKRRIAWIIPVVVAGLMIYGCSPKSKYERRLKHELQSGVRFDSIFMGIYFGMSDKDFYTRCWELNREGLIRQGPSNMTVEYEMRNELKTPARMYFYPEFGKGKIIELPVRFVYSGWAPWNKALSSDSLQADVLQWYEKNYGTGFITVKHPKRGMAHVKVDGNRRITIFREDDMYVWAIFTDMLAKSKVNDSTSREGNRYDEITRDPEQ